MRASRAGSGFQVAILALAWALLFASSRSPALVANVCASTPRASRPPSVLVRGGQDGMELLEYRFRNFLNLDDAISCSIKDEDHLSLEEGFGLFSCTGNSNMPACFKEEKQKITITIVKGLESYVNSRGFRAREKKWIADYAGLAAKAAGAVGGCAQEFQRQFRDPRDWLAFFQAMPQDKVPDFDTDAASRRQRYTGGLLIPTKVLLQNRGDCDSKALAFSALQEDRKNLVIFYSTNVPCEPKGHAFVGVASNPSRYPRRFNLPKELVTVDDSTLDARTGEFRLQGSDLLRYRVMELSGPGVTEVGELDPRHYGKYFGIPLAADRL